MKIAGKLIIVFLLAMLVFTPLQAAQAKGLHDGKIIFGQSYTVKSGETLTGDLVVFGGTVTVEKGGTVMGSIILMGGSVNVDGKVTKDVVVVGGAAQLGSESYISGDVVAFGAPVQRAEGSRVDGNIINNPTPPVVTTPDKPSIEPPIVPDSPARSEFDWFLTPFWNLVNLIVQSIALAMLAMLITLFLPEQTRRIGETAAAQPATAAGMGILSLILFIVMIVALALFSILIITLLLTVPLIVVASIAFAAGAVFGLIGLGTEVGLRLARMVNLHNLPLPVSAAAGTMLLVLISNGIGFIPCIGWIAPFVVNMLGLGAVMMTRFGTRPAPIMATPVPAPSAPPEENAGV